MDCSTFSCDLHVLGTPPALILSQDQTLVCNLLASPTEVGDAPCFVARKPEAGILCEIARTCDSSVPRFIRSHEQTNHLTTGTFNLLSKTESAFRLSGAFQSNSRHSKAPVVLETCHLHGLFRRVETNLSKVPQPFSIRQPAAYIFRADVDFAGASWLHLQTSVPIRGAAI